MTILTARPLALAGFILLALPACANSSAAPTANAAPITGVDLGPSSRLPRTQLAMAGAGHEAHRAETIAAPKNVQPAHDDGSHAHATGTVNSIDPAQHKINLSHQPITALGWPAMTMDFAVAPSVDLNRIKPGSRVDFSLEKDKGGMYEIDTMQPAGK
jgi:Cu(I)/Ag(I) efflux system protein CusF